MSTARFAFLARNQFQARSMAPLCGAVGGVMLCRAKLRDEIADLDVPVRIWKWPWAWLDGRYSVLVMHGADDLQSEAATRLYADAFPNAEFAVIEGAGHAMFEEQPAEFARTIAEFLNNIN